MGIASIFGKILGKPAVIKAGIPLPEAKVTEEVSRKLKVLTAVVEKFQDTERILDYLRTGEYILLLKVKPLRDKDITELKRAINRIRTHCEATGADVAALDDSWIVVVPQSIFIERAAEGG
jgi:SepF-like predicted cell division protein (DUF552 family)